MAVYYSNKWVNNSNGVNTVQPVFNATGEITVIASFAVTTALAAGDIIHMCTIPPNCKITELQLDIDELDSGAALTLEVGDTVNGAAAWVASQAAGQGAGTIIQAPNVVGYLGYAAFTANADMTVQCTHAAGTALLTGSIRMRVSYTPVF